MKQLNKKSILILLLMTYTIGIMLFSLMIFQGLQPDITNRATILGLWNSQTDGERIIQIRVDNRNINEIIETARHEVCHEIGYRNFADISENFAKNCKLEDYYNATK